MEACGGCPGAVNKDGSPAGVDCTALPNVDVVSCVEGSCAIGELFEVSCNSLDVADVGIAILAACRAQSPAWLDLST